ncbi:MFS transporter [Rhizobium halophytocola]|uniref:MFS family arabinose efflux permease n=1 Tax=Rhizobium halophytocola TaxID=735519 RepID=A0ABS4DW19_9HYPH|nr:MFS transporter [Rhizobium halophytocola]MBP1849888.1 putative MFS family arabinose efflux permease [Rhizobium halophytocola]
MFSSLGYILRSRQLTALSLMVFLVGTAGAATLPYLSVTAIGELHISNRNFSLIIFASAITAVTISVVIGILSDRMHDRRPMTAILALVGALGFGSIFLFPRIPVFVGATVLLIPFFQAVLATVFSTTRLETASLSPREAAQVNATIRTALSAAWVLMPGAIGLLLAGAGCMLGAWGLAGLACLLVALAAAFLLRAPDGPRGHDADRPGFVAGLKALATPAMLVRLLSISAITATIRLTANTWPLILTLELGGTTANVGLIAGIVALVEIPFMLLWASALRRIGIVPIIIAAALLYMAQMLAISMATAAWQIYGLTALGGAAAAALLSMPLSYFQDLFPGRPGLGTSLFPINNFIGNGLTALAFAAGTHFFGYGGTLWLGAALAGVGIVALLAVERKTAPPAPAA